MGGIWVDLSHELYDSIIASSNVTSTHGHNKTQGFVNGDSFFVYHFPMISKKEAHHGLVAYIHDVGIPAKIHTDNAKVETLRGVEEDNSGISH